MKYGNYIIKPLKNLSQNEQKIVFLRLWNNLTFKDISSLLNKSISTISGTYYNAIDKIKSSLIIKLLKRSK